MNIKKIPKKFRPAFGRLVSIENHLYIIKPDDKNSNANPNHDKLGRFTTGTHKGFYKVKDGETFGEATEIAPEKKVSYNGEKFEGKQISVYPEKLRAAGIKPSITDPLQINEYESLIEAGSSGKVLVFEDSNYKYNVVDGNHTLGAYYKLEAQGKQYRVPVVFTKDQSVADNTKISKSDKEFIETENNLKLEKNNEIN